MRKEEALCGIGKLFGWFDGIGKLKASYTIRDGGKEF
jgi:hypothetical protein